MKYEIESLEDFKRLLSSKQAKRLFNTRKITESRQEKPRKLVADPVAYEFILSGYLILSAENDKAENDKEDVITYVHKLPEFKHDGSKEGYEKILGTKGESGELDKHIITILDLFDMEKYDGSIQDSLIAGALTQINATLAKRG